MGQKCLNGPSWSKKGAYVFYPKGSLKGVILKRKEKIKNPRSNLIMLRVIMRGQINCSTKISKVAKKGRLYEPQRAAKEPLWSIERTPNRACVKGIEWRVYISPLDFRFHHLQCIIFFFPLCLVASDAVAKT